MNKEEDKELTQEEKDRIEYQKMIDLLYESGGNRNNVTGSPE